MPKRITIAEHLNISELEQLYRQAKNGGESRQYQIIWLLAQGKKTAICGGNNRLQKSKNFKPPTQMLKFNFGVKMSIVWDLNPLCDEFMYPKGKPQSLLKGQLEL